MSNAMRSGKRWLAGVAAVALGAGALTFISASPASASAAANITLDNAGLTVVANATFADSFLVNVVATDALGNVPTTLTGAGATQVGTVEILNPSLLSTPPTVTGSPLTFNADTGRATFTIDAATDWASTTPGSYVARVAITSEVTGASITKDFPVRVFGASITPTATLRWVQGAENPNTLVNALSGVVGDSVAAPVGYARLFAGANALLIDAAMDNFDTDPALTASTTRSYFDDGASGDVNTAAAVELTTVQAGVTTGVYAVSANPVTANTAVWLAGTQNYALSYNQTTTSSTTSRLPIILASKAGLNTVTELTTTPSLEVAPADQVTNADIEYQVPVGTTTLSFASTTDDTPAGTVAWSTTSNAPGGSVTASAGVSAITTVGVNNVYNTTITLNAPAAASGAITTYVSGSGFDVAVVSSKPVPEIDAPDSLIAKVGESVTITGSVADQWGRPLSAASVVSLFAPDQTLLGSVVPGADGAFSFTVPAALAPKTPDALDFDIQATVGGDLPQNKAITVDYTATGQVASLTIASQPVAVSGQIPAIQVPAGGSLELSNVTASLVNPASPGTGTGSEGQVVFMTFDSDPATSITVTGSEGVYFSTRTSGAVNWNAGKSSVIVNDLDQLTVWTTKTGKSTITATAGGKTATQDIWAFTPATAARNVALSPATLTLPINSFRSLELTVTDVFGNPVRGVTVGTATTNQVIVSLAGGGQLPNAFSATGVDGKSVFSFTSLTATGDAEVVVAGNTAAGAGTQFGTTILDAPAAVRTAKTTITVTPTITKSIAIVGERTTVSGKSGILVEGTVRGIENGKTVVPYIRFPGETTFTAGTARPIISNGDFTWQRKTGKRVTVYVTSDDGQVISNRVTIQAS